MTPGGGGDGEAMVDWVLRAYESDASPPYPALLVYGPFMRQEKQLEFARRGAKLKNIEAITFDANIEPLIQGSSGIVAMKDYNTFCEILTDDKLSDLPRTVPVWNSSSGQIVPQEPGLVRMLEDDSIRNAGIWRPRCIPSAAEPAVGHRRTRAAGRPAQCQQTSPSAYRRSGPSSNGPSAPN